MTLARSNAGQGQNKIEGAHLCHVGITMLGAARKLVPISGLNTTSGAGHMEVKVKTK